MMHKMMVVTSSYALYTMMIMNEMVVTSSHALMMMMNDAQDDGRYVVVHDDE